MWPVVLGLLAVAFATFSDQGGFYYYGGSLLFALAVAALLWVVEAAPRSRTGGPALDRTGSLGRHDVVRAVPVALADPRLDRRSRARALTRRPTQLVELGLTVRDRSRCPSILLERPIREGRAPWIGFSRRRLLIAAIVSFELVWFAAVMGTMITSSNSAIARGLKDVSDTSVPFGQSRVRHRRPFLVVRASRGADRRQSRRLDGRRLDRACAGPRSDDARR